MAGVEVVEVVEGVFRLALPLGIHGVPTVSAYLLRAEDGDTLVDCGIAAGVDGGNPGPDGTAAVSAALAAVGSTLERVERLVVTHAHIDHFDLAGEVVRRSGGELWMHRRTDLDLEKYADPDEAVDRRTLMLADHGLFGPELTESSEGLRDWMPVMPSVGRPSRLLGGGEQFTAAGRTWEVVHTPGHSPGHVCLWNADERLLCSGDHLLQWSPHRGPSKGASSPIPWGPTWTRWSACGTSRPSSSCPGTGRRSTTAPGGPRPSPGASGGA